MNIHEYQAKVIDLYISHLFKKKYELIREIVVDGDPINSIFKKK